jgi:hypothetical protein
MAACNPHPVPPLKYSRLPPKILAWDLRAGFTLLPLLEILLSVFEIRMIRLLGQELSCLNLVPGSLHSLVLRSP